MASAHAFLRDLATVLGVAAVTTVVFQLLRQPPVLGYVLAGLLIGPQTPLPLVADRATIQTLSELGVILLMFSLGLEFSIRKLVRLGGTAVVITAIEVGAVLWLGFTASRALGWSIRESLFAGAAVSISSTMIVAKVFAEQGVEQRLRDLVYGILVVEDLVAVLLLALLTAVGTGMKLTADDLVSTVGRLGGFLVALVAVGLLVVPRAIRFVSRLRRPETLLVASVGVCFATALLAQAAGYSVALGAFLAGSLVAESGAGGQVEGLIRPLRDIFGAVFFVAVGMLMDPTVLQQHWPTALVLTGVVLAGKVVGVLVGAFLTGHGVQSSIRASMSMAQIGEFSFIIATLGLSLRVTGDFLFPVAVAVSVLTTFTTPWMVRAALPVALAVDKRLPGPLQMFVTLYGSWLEQVRAIPAGDNRGARLRRLVRSMLTDAALLVANIIGASVFLRGLLRELAGTAGITVALARALIVGVAALLALPCLVGIFSAARRLGGLLAETVLPSQLPTRVDLAATPRRVLILSLQLGILLAVGLPVLAVTQPFLPAVPGVVVLSIPLVILAVLVWRGATNLEGHVRAGSQMIVEVLGKQGHGDEVSHALEQVQEMLPGCGTLHAVVLDARAHAVGKTLAELNLRGLTGATVLALVRGHAGVVIPTPQQALQAGDVLALTGAEDAVASATRLLTTGEPSLAA
ncbi:MAG: cation:proton antiporter [Myxococcota bacterium]